MTASEELPSTKYLSKSSAEDEPWQSSNIVAFFCEQKKSAMF